MRRFFLVFPLMLLALSLSGCGPQNTGDNVESRWTEPPQDQPVRDQKEERQDTAAVSWEFDGEQWRSFPKQAATCPDPIVMQSPVDMTLVSGILYPGQSRGGNYKPHGGFRFDEKKNTDVTVRAPFDATLTVGSRYIEQGETQYVLWFENACGVAYRFDHLLTLAPMFQQAAETLPPAQPDDSRTTRFATPISVRAGDVIATAVGFAKTQNVSLDWGVYDLRQTNAAAKKADFAEKHAAEKSQAYYGICWFDLLPADTAAGVRALPAASPEGKTSDYCK